MSSGVERISLFAVSGYDINILNPTAEEIELYNEIRKEVLETNAKADAEGRKIIWEIPFDP